MYVCSSQACYRERKKKIPSINHAVISCQLYISFSFSFFFPVPPSFLFLTSHLPSPHFIRHEFLHCCVVICSHVDIDPGCVVGQLDLRPQLHAHIKRTVRHITPTRCLVAVPVAALTVGAAVVNGAAVAAGHVVDFAGKDVALKKRDRERVRY